MESAREEILRQIRTGLKRGKDEAPPPVRLKPNAGSPELFLKADHRNGRQGPIAPHAYPMLAITWKVPSTDAPPSHPMHRF